MSARRKQSGSRAKKLGIPAALAVFAIAPVVVAAVACGDDESKTSSSTTGNPGGDAGQDVVDEPIV